MYRFDNRIHFSEQRSSLGSAILLLLIVLVGFVGVGPVVGFFAAMPLIDGPTSEFFQKLSPPFTDPSVKTALFVIQGCATAVGLILIPALFLKIRENMSLNVFFKRPINLGFTSLLVLFVLFSFMGVNSFFIEWNQNFVFPEFMRGFEEWARTTEQNAADAVEFLTTMDSTGQLVLAFLVIAVLPSIGEELVFRGLLQNYFHKSFLNIHVAIWLAAILFSAIHVQFYGFVPRVLLGALFGYLYYWSANLWVPIIAHFFNNGFTVLMVYLHQKDIVDFDLESTESPPWYAIFVFAVLTFLLMRYFYSYFKKYYLIHDKVEERIQDERQDPGRADEGQA